MVIIKHILVIVILALLLNADIFTLLKVLIYCTYCNLYSDALIVQVEWLECDIGYCLKNNAFIVS